MQSPPQRFQDLLRRPLRRREGIDHPDRAEFLAVLHVLGQQHLISSLASSSLFGHQVPSPRPSTLFAGWEDVSSILAERVYLHCDPTASHFLKLLMDAVFGPTNFRTEIIWKRTGAHGRAKRWGPIHDTILFYTGVCKICVEQGL